MDYKSIALEALKHIRSISDNEAFPSSVDGSEIDIDKTISKLTPLIDNEFNFIKEMNEEKEELEKLSNSVNEKMKLLIMHHMREKGIETFTIEDLDTIHSDGGVSAGEYMDAVTKVTSNGDYFYTHNGERSEETDCTNIAGLPLKSLEKILTLVQES